MIMNYLSGTPSTTVGRLSVARTHFFGRQRCQHAGATIGLPERSIWDPAQVKGDHLCKALSGGV